MTLTMFLKFWDVFYFELLRGDLYNAEKEELVL